MFQPLKNLFSKLGKKPSAPAPAPAPAPTAPPPSKLAPPAKEPKPAAPRTAPAPAPTAAAPAPAAPAPQPAGGAPEETFALPLRVVLSRLPASLAASVKSTGGGDLQLPLRKVLSQLPQGSVKISFGELRHAAPPGTFLEVASQDATLIELPLPEIVSRINPSLISRRSDQKTIEVPPEVGNVFGPHGETIAPPTGATAPAPAAPAKPAAPAPAPAPAPTAPKPILPTASAPALPKPPAAAPAPSSPALPKPPAPAVPTPPKPTPPAPAAPAPSIPAPKLPTAPTAPSIPKPPTPAPSLPKPPAPAAPSAPIAAPKLPTPTAPSLPKPAAPTPVAPIGTTTPAAVPTHSTQFFLEKEATPATGTLSVALSAISAAWPESVKQEIAQQNLKDSSVALPMGNVETGLKTGKLVFAWREIGGWLEPKPFTTSGVGDTLLELPLKVIAPKFIEQHKPAKPQKKLSLGENIPDIFSGAAAAPKPAAAAPAPAPAPAPAAPAPALPKLPTAPAPAPAPAAPAVPAAKVPTTIGEVFGDTAKTDWSPRDIVTKMGSVKGLAGGVISTHDGLMVAGELPAPMKADMVAAFLPQIFSRMNQYGKELQLGGDLNTVAMTFDKVPWQISKLGKVYFAAAGRAGEPLPSAQLAVICGELAKQNK